ncbi:MAG: CotH kinase family protein [Verrucomicrobiales bacterium]|nr:CotH kinase family protein [Verrucomicrobiales bacterium]
MTGLPQVPRPGVVIALLFGLLSGVVAAPVATNAVASPTSPPFSEFRITLGADALHRLRESPRKSVTAMVRRDGRELPGARIHLKGSTGSFQPVDERPSLTVSFDTPSGPARLHLENSVEDPSLLHYWLGSEVFREAGLPVPRVSHARVELDGRALGLYVLRDGYDPAFLAVALGDPGGILYEPRTGADITGTLESKNSPAGDLTTRGAATLADLNAALEERDPVRRFARISNCLDTQAFATLIAGEVLLEHRDGYALARNNYRVLWRASDGRLILIPHGMDQLFVGANFAQHPHLGGTLARSLLGTPEGLRQYDDSWRRLSRQWWKPGAWEERVRGKLAEWEPHLTRGESKALHREAEDLLLRIQRRGTQIQSPPVKPDVPN